jgi:hypothetical protein
VELKVRVININYGVSEFTTGSNILGQYSRFIETVKYYQKTKEAAPIRRAINECKEKEILKDFLTKHGSEVENMLLKEWKWEEALNTREQEGREEGREEGKEIATLRMVKNLLDVLDDETISKKSGYTIEKVAKIREKQKHLI